MIKAMRVIFINECKLLHRQTQEWATPLTFFALILFLFPLAFPNLRAEALPACVWIASLFASCLSLQTLFLSDLEKNSLAQWALAPTPLALLVMAKLAAYWLITQLPLILFTLILSFFLNINENTVFILILSLLLSSPTIILLCSLSLALTVGLKQQGLLLSLIVIPLVLPLLILGMNASLLAEQGASVIHLLAAMAGISLLSVIALPPAIAAALRIALDY